MVRATAEADFVAYTGATSLIEKYPLAAKFDQIDLAIDLGRPVVLMPQSLGPFLDPVHQESMRRVAATAALYPGSRRTVPPEPC